MRVLKRDGRKELVRFDKISARIRPLAKDLDKNFVDHTKVAQKVIEGLYDGVTTAELDNLASEIAASMAPTHPDFNTLAARISVSNLHKNTLDSFSKTIHHLYHYKDSKNRLSTKIIAKEFYDFIMSNAEKLDNAIDYSRDYEFDYFGFRTLEKGYLFKLDNKIIERPQHMLMRVSIQIHAPDIEKIINTYNLMSEQWFIHATPTLFNSCTPKPQLSSCFLLPIEEDSIEGIYNTLKKCALISQSAGGIGLSIHNIRAKGSYIRGTNGQSNGIVPMLRVFNDTARYVDQGGGKRKGAFAIYLEPWHADIFEFLDLKKNHGKEELRARDLFYALWIPDIFMKRVETNGEWSLFCPNEAPGLYDVYGKEFEEMYEKYEREGRQRKKIRAQELWSSIIESQIETGTPYMLYKDHVNSKSNQKNIGVIRSSNLCTEIMQYSSKDEVAVCNLASVSLPKFVQKGSFNHERLYEVIYTITQNLNKVIEKNYYPVKESEVSNKKHLPIGIGVQGIADVFMLLKYPFTSDEAKKLNKEIFETIYFSALNASKDLAMHEGTYDSYDGSPISKGILQYDMWDTFPSSRWDWDSLKEEIKKHGVRNSLLVAPMPTASTSQILGNCECFEPYTSNMYTRKVLSGEFIVINKHLMKDLIALNLWDEDMKQRIIANGGSVQSIDGIPSNIKEIYKTVWEISQKDLITMAADRAPYICQSQSLNLFVKKAIFREVNIYAFLCVEKRT